VPRHFLAFEAELIMPGIAKLSGRTVHYCAVCFLAYDDRELARRCEEHCRTHPSCSLELGRQAAGSVADPSAEAKEGRGDDPPL
jgi:hypothetical protein